MPGHNPCIRTVDDLLASLQTKYLFYVQKRLAVMPAELDATVLDPSFSLTPSGE